MHYEKLKKHKATVIIALVRATIGGKEETSVIVKFHKKRSPHRIGRETHEKRRNIQH